MTELIPSERGEQGDQLGGCSNNPSGSDQAIVGEVRRTGQFLDIHLKVRPTGFAD